MTACTMGSAPPSRTRPSSTAAGLARTGRSWASRTSTPTRRALIASAASRCTSGTPDLPERRGQPTAIDHSTPPMVGVTLTMATTRGRQIGRLSPDVHSPAGSGSLQFTLARPGAAYRGQPSIRGRDMRAEFQADLAEISVLLVAMADEVRDAMRRATKALLEADAVTAEGVVTGDEAVDHLQREIEEKVYALLARQAPVASDLRLVVSALHIAADFERMGDLAKHVAKTALRRHPARAVPEELAGTIRDMAAVADRLRSEERRVGKGGR